MSGMNLEDEMMFVMQTVEPEESKKVDLKEAFPDASGCTMETAPVTSRDKEEINKIFEIQSEMFEGLKDKSQTKKKVSGEKKNKFVKNKSITESVLDHREVIEKFQMLDKEEQRIVLKILIDIF